MADLGQGLQEGDDVHLIPPISGGALALAFAPHGACAEVKEVMPK
jgi:hypothetical protein